MKPLGKYFVGFVTVLAGAGCTQHHSDDGIQPLVTGSATSQPVLSASPSHSPGQPGGVRAHVQYQVTSGADTRVLVAFIEAHARSMIRQRVTGQLAKLATPRELARQRQAIRFARRHNYTVPTHPVVRIPSITRTRPRQRQVGVCLWLPSTEYLDRQTGRSPAGQVPQSWAAAIAILRRQTVSWKVDRVSSPTDHEKLSCGGRP